MNVFNNQQRSGYEEIASYSPRYYRRIKEMDAVFRLSGHFTDLMAADLEKTVASVFIDYMDEETFSDYEAFLLIRKDPNKTLQERKDYVKALHIGSGKMSKDKIIAIVNQFVECDCDVALQNGELYVHMIFKDDPHKYMEDIRVLIQDKIPAHIGIIYHGTEALDIVVVLKNIVTVERTRHEAEFYLYNGQATYLDGSVLLDGKMHLGNILDLFPVKDRHRIEVVLKKKVSYLDGSLYLDGSKKLDEEWVNTDSVTIRRNMYYLNGSRVLDGSTKLNSEEWKEDL